MANIMLTECCNLQCPYCFANEFVDDAGRHISNENFSKALTFIKSAHDFEGCVGLIGGEPTIAPIFGDAIRMLDEDEQIRKVAIYTNGILLERYIKVLKSKKFDFLINFNSPDDSGREAYERTLIGIGKLIEAHKKSSIALGINLYDVSQDTGYFLDAIKHFDIQLARVAVTVPNNGANGLNHLKTMRKKLLRLTTDLMYENVNYTIDCNRPPECIWDENDMMKMTIMRHRLVTEPKQSSRCNPVIDILPDLTAVRCFGMSRFTKVSINDFVDIDELYGYYMDMDKKIAQIPSDSHCEACSRAGECYGGCLANKGVLYCLGT